MQIFSVISSFGNFIIKILTTRNDEEATAVHLPTEICQLSIVNCRLFTDN